MAHLKRRILSQPSPATLDPPRATPRYSTKTGLRRWLRLESLPARPAGVSAQEDPPEFDDDIDILATVEHNIG